MMYHWDSKISWHTQNNKCNIPCEQNENKSQMVVSADAEKAFNKTTSFHGESSQQIGSRVTISQLNEDYI